MTARAPARPLRLFTSHRYGLLMIAHTRPAKAMILGCLGQRLTADEKAFYRDEQPWGFILFGRNIDTPDQIRRLTAELRAAVGREAPVLIDQEGGRVQRLRAPRWRDWAPPLGTPPAALALRFRLIAAELRALGIDADCAPVGDIAGPDTHPFLRDRCYGEDAARVTAAARRRCADSGGTSGQARSHRDCRRRGSRGRRTGPVSRWRRAAVRALAGDGRRRRPSSGRSRR